MDQSQENQLAPGQGLPAPVCSPSELFLNFYAHGPIGVWRDADGAKETGNGFRAERIAVRFREAPDFSEVEEASPAEMEYAAEVVEKLELMASFSPIGDLADVIGEILETALADAQEAISKANDIRQPPLPAGDSTNMKDAAR